MQTRTELKHSRQVKNATEATPNHTKGAQEAKPDKTAKPGEKPNALNRPKTGKERWKARKLSRSKTLPEVLHTSISRGLEFSVRFTRKPLAPLSLEAPECFLRLHPLVLDRQGAVRLPR